MASLPRQSALRSLAAFSSGMPLAAQWVAFPPHRSRSLRPLLPISLDEPPDNHHTHTILIQIPVPVAAQSWALWEGGRSCPPAAPAPCRLGSPLSAEGRPGSPLAGDLGLAARHSASLPGGGSSTCLGPSSRDPPRPLRTPTCYARPCPPARPAPHLASPGTPPASGSGSPRRASPLRRPPPPAAATWAAS